MDINEPPITVNNIKNKDKSKLDVYIEIPEVDMEEATAKNTFEIFSLGIIKKYKKKVIKIININKCKSSRLFFSENCLVIMSWSKKKLNTGINKVIDKMNIWKLVETIDERLSTGRKPPEEIVVNDSTKASSSLISNNLYKNIISVVKIK